MAAAAPELCPMMTVSSSHLRSFSMNGSQMLSLAVTVGLHSVFYYTSGNMSHMKW